VSTIAFIGLGIMGSPMAVNIARAGHEVVGYNRSPARAADLVDAGGTAADSIAAAVQGAHVVALMLPDSPDVETVLTSEHGVFDSAAPATLIIDFSSIRPDVTTALATRARERGFRMIDAPVSGGETGAINGQLSIMVGGTPEDVAAAQPVLDAVGTTVVHVGPSGSGQTVKAANQLIVAGNLELLAEAIVFLEAYGVDTTAARAAGVITPLGAMVAQLMASARAYGDGALDHSALLRGVERLSGQERIE
jgi:2-hydroxy-3-oxopropionate reductase